MEASLIPLEIVCKKEWNLLNQERSRFCLLNINPLSANPIKWSNTLNLSAFADELFECVWVFDYFVGLALKGLTLGVH